jgi:hypothetical protein
MKWHNLMILLASLMLVAVTFADEFEIPDDIDDDDLDEDEEILRLLEQKRIVRWNRKLKCARRLTVNFFLDGRFEARK